MAELSWQEGLLARKESQILISLLSLQNTRVRDAMTPKIVVFSISQEITVGTYFREYGDKQFSRIPVYQDGDNDHVTGFVLRNDLLLAQAKDEFDRPVLDFVRELPAVVSSTSLSKAFDDLLKQRAHIVLVVDEYGGTQGILTLEDVLETILGLEIVDESDAAHNMQDLARELWRQRALAKGLDPDILKNKD